MNAVKDDIPALIEKELAAANKVYPLFHSNHEAYGVILEEYKEAKAATKSMKAGIKLLFVQIMNDRPQDEIDQTLAMIRKASTRTAEESIQVAAMCEKAIDSDSNYSIVINCHRVTEELLEKNERTKGIEEESNERNSSMDAKVLPESIPVQRQCPET